MKISVNLWVQEKQVNIGYQFGLKKKSMLRIPKNDQSLTADKQKQLYIE